MKIKNVLNVFKNEDADWGTEPALPWQFKPQHSGPRSVGSTGTLQGNKQFLKQLEEATCSNGNVPTTRSGSEWKAPECWPAEGHVIHQDWVSDHLTGLSWTLGILPTVKMPWMRDVDPYHSRCDPLEQLSPGVRNMCVNTTEYMRQQHGICASITWHMCINNMEYVYQHQQHGICVSITWNMCIKNREYVHQQHGIWAAKTQNMCSNNMEYVRQQSLICASMTWNMCVNNSEYVCRRRGICVSTIWNMCVNKTENVRQNTEYVQRQCGICVSAT